MLPVFSCGLACVCFVKADCYPRKPAQSGRIVDLTLLYFNHLAYFSPITGETGIIAP
jgi:hypothetical protein